MGRLTRTFAGILAFLAGYEVLLLLMLHFFLEPAAQAARHADPAAKHWLHAVAWLMLSVTLAYLILGLILTFRMGRYFFPKPGPMPRPERTEYVDVWTEAGKRMKPEAADADDEE